MSVDLPAFRSDKWKNRAEAGKMLNFQGLEEGFLPFVLEWLELPRFTILIQNILSI